jgi:hypothetical protein
MKSSNARRTGDRHLSSFRLRLPVIFQTKLELLKDKTGKPMTELVQSALKFLLRRFGLWRKKDDEQLQRETKNRSWA